MSIRGHADYIGIAEDNAAYGTFKAPTNFILSPTVIAPVITGTKLEVDAVRGLLSKHANDTELGYRFASFGIAGVLPIITTGPEILLLLKHFFGKVVLTGVAAPYTHAFTLDATTNDVPTLGLSVAYGVGTSRRKFAGCRVVSLKFGSTAAGPLTFEAQLVGIDNTEDTTMDTPAFVEYAGPPFKWRGGLGAFTFKTVAMALASWELTLSQAIETSERVAGALGNDCPVQLVRTGHVELAGKIERRWLKDGATHSKLYEQWLTRQDFALQFKFEGPIIGAGPSKHTFQIDANVMIPVDKEPTRPKESQLIMESAELEGRDDGTNRIVSVTSISSSATPAST
jgi:hypothetical protein